MARRLILVLALSLTVGCCATKPLDYLDETQAMAAAGTPLSVTGA